MLPLSVSVMCKNNERTIGRMLDSVRGLAAEVVALDNGSTDGTLRILEEGGATIHREEWRGYVRTKQRALDLCAQEWVVCLDSDESLEPDLAASLRRMIEADAHGHADALHRVSGYMVNRKVWYRGRALNHAWQPEWRLRVVRKGKGAWGGIDPHDELRLTDAGARVGKLSGTLRHDSFETFEEFLGKQLSHARVAARARHDAGKRASVLKLAVSPPAAFFKQVILKSAWRDGWPGWLAAASAAASRLLTHAIQLEIERREGTAGKD